MRVVRRHNNVLTLFLIVQCQLIMWVSLFSALAEMESVLKSVAKQRAGQGSSQSSFVNYLLQANLTERQVTTQHIFKSRS